MIFFEQSFVIFSSYQSSQSLRDILVNLHVLINFLISKNFYKSAFNFFHAFFIKIKRVIAWLLIKVTFSICSSISIDSFKVLFFTSLCRRLVGKIIVHSIIQIWVIVDLVLSVEFLCSNSKFDNIILFNDVVFHTHAPVWECLRNCRVKRRKNNGFCGCIST